MVLALIVPLQEQAERPQLCIEAKHRYHIPQQPWGESSRRIGLSHTDLGIQDLSFLAPFMATGQASTKPPDANEYGGGVSSQTFD